MADTNVKLCATCGREVDLNVRYRAWCGAYLGAPEEQNAQQDGVKGEAMVGWVYGVVSGNKWGIGNRVLLFTTDRMVVAYASDWADAVAHYKTQAPSVSYRGAVLSQRHKARRFSGFYKRPPQ